MAGRGGSGADASPRRLAAAYGHPITPASTKSTARTADGRPPTGASCSLHRHPAAVPVVVEERSRFRRSTEAYPQPLLAREAGPGRLSGPLRRHPGRLRRHLGRAARDPADHADRRGRGAGRFRGRVPRLPPARGERWTNTGLRHKARRPSLTRAGGSSPSADLRVWQAVHLLHSGSEKARFVLRFGARCDLVPHTGFLVKRLIRLSRVHPVHPGDA